MVRTWICALLLLVPAATAASAQAEHPSAIQIGTESVARAGQASRVHLLGTEPFYTIALYAAGTLDTRLVSDEAPKALRIVVTFQDDVRRPFIPDWRRELLPGIDADAVAQLRRAFSALRHGSVVLIEYVPGKGSSVRIDARVAVSNAHHDLMLAFLDHWLGQRPVSEEIKRALLGAS